MTETQQGRQTGVKQLSEEKEEKSGDRRMKERGVETEQSVDRGELSQRRVYRGEWSQRRVES